MLAHVARGLFCIYITAQVCPKDMTLVLRRRLKRQVASVSDMMKVDRDGQTVILFQESGTLCSPLPFNAIARGDPVRSNCWIR